MPVLHPTHSDKAMPEPLGFVTTISGTAEGPQDDLMAPSKMLGMGGTSIILVAKCALPDSLAPAFGKTVGFYCDTI